MDFSELFKFSGKLAFSPNGKYVANSAGYRLVIRDIETLQVVALFNCLDEISRIEWSFDSKYILCAVNKRAAVEVFSISDFKWNCKIDEGAAGVSFARFSPDGRHILTCADFQLRITIWSLTNKSGHVAYIKYPKYSNKGLDFTRDGKYMALAERRDCKDYISIITTDTWELVKNFAVDTKQLADIKWSPDGRVLAVWDSLLDYKVVLYSPDGTMIKTYSAYDDALGIRLIRWSPSSQLLAIGSYDSKVGFAFDYKTNDVQVRLLNNLTWKVIGEYKHELSITDKKILVFKEVEYSGMKTEDVLTVTTTTRYIICDVPVQLKEVKVNYNKANPNAGIGIMEWSPNGKYLCTRSDNIPNVLWIWETAKLSCCAVIIHLDPVKCAKWDPKNERVAFCTGNGRVYMWSVEGCSCVDAPAVNFRVQSLKWNSTGEVIALQDVNNFCCCYPPVNA